VIYVGSVSKEPVAGDAVGLHRGAAALIKELRAIRKAMVSHRGVPFSMVCVFRRSDTRVDARRVRT